MRPIWLPCVNGVNDTARIGLCTRSHPFPVRVKLTCRHSTICSLDNSIFVRAAAPASMRQNGTIPVVVLVLVLPRRPQGSIPNRLPWCASHTFLPTRALSIPSKRLVSSSKLTTCVTDHRLDQHPSCIWSTHANRSDNGPCRFVICIVTVWLGPVANTCKDRGVQDSSMYPRPY